MLSRVANSVYWMTRYIERAENIARFISVNLNLTLDFATEENRQWQPIIMATGDHSLFEDKYGKDYSSRNVIHFLALDQDYSNSIISSLRAARENGRSVREIISSEMWEQVNRYYLDMNDAANTDFAYKNPHKFFKIITMQAHMFTGLLYTTMSHGEPFQFALTGLLLERADKTSRILDVKYFMLLPQAGDVNTPYDSIQWAAVLKSASALEMYRKRFHRIIPKQVCEFLIFDSDFPRSIRYCLKKAEKSLHNISGTPAGTVSNKAEKSLGRLCADLDYTDIDEIIDTGMHEYLDGLQIKINNIGNNIHDAFFKLTLA
ncbi:MAG: alpha-E domain-containing protein [Desulfamplus sp.]|nr:alpha-E domain-containing protein [Desulfamplus sp.]